MPRVFLSEYYLADKHEIMKKRVRPSSLINNTSPEAEVPAWVSINSATIITIISICTEERKIKKMWGKWYAPECEEA